MIWLSNTATFAHYVAAKSVEIDVDVPLAEAHIQWLSDFPRTARIELTDNVMTPMKLTSPLSAQLNFPRFRCSVRVLLVAAKPVLRTPSVLRTASRPSRTNLG